MSNYEEGGCESSVTHVVSCQCPMGYNFCFQGTFNFSFSG